MIVARHFNGGWTEEEEARTVGTPEIGGRYRRWHFSRPYGTGNVSKPTRR